MSDFIIYIFKSAIWIAVFYGIYRFFFRNETFLRFNRGFLLAGLVASFILALCQLRYPVEVMNLALSETASTQATVNDTMSVSFDRMTFLLWIYMVGAFALFLYYGFDFSKIRKLIHKQSVNSGEKSNIIYIPGIQSSFSFFGYVFMDPHAGLQNIEKKVILAHETAHVEQLHWIDVLFAQLVCVFQWFNPFAWLYLNAVKQNHEFLADRSVIEKGYPPAVYQAVLINSTFKVPVFAFTNSFAYYHKFKRIEIMKKNISKPVKKWAVLLLLPAFAGFLAAFAQPEYRYVEVIGQVPDTDGKPVTKGKIVSIALKDEPNKTTEKLDSGKIILLGKAKIQTSADSLSSVIATNSPLIIVDGQVYTSSPNNLNPVNIESIDIFKDKAATSLYGEKGKNGVVSIKMKKTACPEPAEDSVHTNMKEIEYNKSDKTKEGIENAIQVNGTASRIEIRTLADSSVMANSPLIIVDGQEYTSSLNNIEAKDIESVTVLKDHSAISLYGEKGKKNGVIIIKKKK